MHNNMRIFKKMHYSEARFSLFLEKYNGSVDHDLIESIHMNND